MTGMIQTVKWVSELKGWVYKNENITSKSVPMNEGDKMFGNLSNMLTIYCASA